jgi:hypothetical protein
MKDLINFFKKNLELKLKLSNFGLSDKDIK